MNPIRDEAAHPRSPCISVCVVERQSVLAALPQRRARYGAAIAARMAHAER